MALPQLAPARRVATRKTADVLRRKRRARFERSELLAQLADRRLSLHNVLDRDDEIAGELTIGGILTAVPRVGTELAHTLLGALNIPASRRLHELSDHEYQRLLDVFPQQWR